MAAPTSISFVPNPGERHRLQLKVTLLHTQPKIWRSLVVSSDLPMPLLHTCMQVSMGWENEHMHSFYKEENRERVYFEPELDDFFGGLFDGGDPKKVIYTKLVVTDVLSSPKARLFYEYDFGDSWLHEIVVEKLLPIGEGLDIPHCLAGEMACPPEDCGGIPGYYDMLETLEKGDQDEKEDLLEWLGKDFAPAAFDLAAINKMLAKVAKPKRAKVAQSAKGAGTAKKAATTKKKTAKKKPQAKKMWVLDPKKKKTPPKE
jgi:Plasmid pRiA4b ORF-3-like protein